MRYLILLLCLLGVGTLKAQTVADTSAPKCTYSVKSFAQETWQTEKRCWTKPFHIQKKDWKMIVPALAGTALVLCNDRDLFAEVQRYTLRNPESYKQAKDMTHLGEGPAQVGLAGLFYGTGLLFRNEKAKETGLLGAQALLHAGVFVTVAKYIAGRERPQAGQHNGNFEGPIAAIHSSNHNSFPSGHTTSAWALATVIATQYQSTVWVPVLCYASAFTCGLSRVVLEKHWPGDVVAGSLLGYAIGKATVQVHRANCKRNALRLNSSLTGMQMTYTF